jgi:hypothetical protein
MTETPAHGKRQWVKEQAFKSTEKKSGYCVDTEINVNAK